MFGLLGFLAMVSYFMVAAYHGKVKGALAETGKLGLQSVWFIGGLGLLYALHDVEEIREPVDIFSAIVLVAFLIHSKSKLSSETSAVYQYLTQGAGKAASQAGTSANNTAAIGGLPQLPSLTGA